MVLAKGNDILTFFTGWIDYSKWFDLDILTFFTRWIDYSKWFDLPPTPTPIPL